MSMFISPWNVKGPIVSIHSECNFMIIYFARQFGFSHWEIFMYMQNTIL